MKLPLAAWFCAVLSLAPALPLVHQSRPYMGYLVFAAAVLAIAAWSARLWRPRFALLAVLAVTSIAWGQFATRERVARVDADGLPADPIVRAVLESRQAAARLRAAVPTDPAGLASNLVIYQPEHTRPDAQATAEVSMHHAALAGPHGVSILFPEFEAVMWTGSILSAPADAFVVAEKTTGFQAWGSTYDAVLYTAQLGVIVKNYDLALACLDRASALDPGREPTIPPDNVLGIPARALAGPREAFDTWLMQKAIRKEITGEEYMTYSGFLAAD